MLVQLAELEREILEAALRATSPHKTSCQRIRTIAIGGFYETLRLAAEAPAELLRPYLLCPALC
jgi:hypothetical protein